MPSPSSPLPDETTKEKSKTLEVHVATCPPKTLHRVLIPKMIYVLKKFLLVHDRPTLLNAVESVLPFLPPPTKNFYSNALHYLTHLRLTSIDKLRMDSQTSKSLPDLLTDLLLFGPDHLINPTRLGYSLCPHITPSYAFTLFNAIYSKSEALNCANTHNRNSRIYTFKYPPVSTSPSAVLKIATDLKSEIDKYLRKPHYVHFDGRILRISWSSTYNQMMGGFSGHLTSDFRYIENPSASESNYARYCVFTAELLGGEQIWSKGGGGIKSEEMFYLKSVQNVLKGEGPIEVIKNLSGSKTKAKIDFGGEEEEKGEDNVQTVTSGEHKIVSTLKGRGVIVSEASKKEMLMTKSAKAVALSDVKQQTIKWSGHAFPGNLGKENDKKVIGKAKKIKFKCTVVMRGSNVREGLRKVVELGAGKLKRKIKENAGERIVIDKLGDV